MNLFRLLKTARWLTTGQIHRRFFQHATINTVHKRLRRLARAGYIAKVQPNPMHVALFTLGKRGKQLLESSYE